jgi:hypothetical protein
MSQFTMDNTEGFTQAQIAAMNDEFQHALQNRLAGLPNGLEGASDDEIFAIKRECADAVCRAHDAA